MILNSIKLHNYRCFNDTVIEFSKNGKIDFIVGVIGTGKTELLFSIWWVLYDFEFKHLKHKESTPYALNSESYKYLESSHDFTSQNCYVELNLDVINDDNSTTNYQIKRIGKFYKQNGKVQNADQFEIIKYRQNGEKELPITDGNAFHEIVSKIIPKKILNGILFDGERMRNLASINKDSIDAIEGVISDITNKEILQSVANLVKIEKQNYYKLRTRISKKSNLNITDAAQEIQDITNDMELKKISLERKKNEQARLHTIIEDVETQYQFIEETRKLINEKTQLTSSLKEVKNNIENIYDEITNKMRSCFLIPMTPVFDDIKEIIDNYDVPRGLNAQAVESILHKGSCICGAHINDEIKIKLERLMLELPPDNLNATIGETRKQNLLKREYFISEFDKLYSRLKENEDRKSFYDKRISEILLEIGTKNDDEIKTLEKQHRESMYNLGVLNEQIQKDTKDYDNLTNRVKTLEELLKSNSSNDNSINRLNGIIEILSRFQTLTDAIIEHNKITALNTINELLNNSFSLLSEDFSFGRRIYITQFINPKYNILAYTEKSLYELNDKINSGVITLDTLLKKFGDFDVNNEEQLHEAKILYCATGNSTGQAKINTLSFVYSIMRYVNSSSKSIEGFSKNNRTYPLLIDAPFSEISGDSLEMIASNLPKFNKQTVVMIDNNTFNENRSHFEKSIGKYYQLKKQSNSTFSIVEEVK